MGSFGGHALPGGFFIVFALWWTVQIYRRHFRSLAKGGLPYKSSVTFPFDFLCGRAKGWQWEGILKVFFTAVGFTLEIITAFKDGRFTHLGNGQHATMFFFFGMSGLVDILLHHGFPLPADTDYVISALAFAVEDLLFMMHLQGRTPMDVLIHTLLVYAIHSSFLICLVEMKHRNNVIVSLTRAYVVLLQGTWFWQAGFILYNPVPGAGKWNEEDHMQMMVVTMMFTWHMAVDFIVILSIGLLVGIVSRCRGSEPLRPGSAARLNGGPAYDQIKLIGSTSGAPDDLDSSDSEVTFNKPVERSVV